MLLFDFFVIIFLFQAHQETIKVYFNAIDFRLFSSLIRLYLLSSSWCERNPNPSPLLYKIFSLLFVCDINTISMLEVSSIVGTIIFNFFTQAINFTSKVNIAQLRCENLEYHFAYTFLIALKISTSCVTEYCSNLIVKPLIVMENDLFSIIASSFWTL